MSTYLGYQWQDEVSILASRLTLLFGKEIKLSFLSTATVRAKGGYDKEKEEYTVQGFCLSSGSSHSDKRDQIRELNEKIDRLKKQYKKLVIYSYKHRSKYNKLMFIFSSDSYYEALKRNKYLSKIAELQKKQFLIIQQHQGLIKEELKSIERERQYKLGLLSEKQQEKFDEEYLAAVLAIDTPSKATVIFEQKKKEKKISARGLEIQRNDKIVSKGVIGYQKMVLPHQPCNAFKNLILMEHNL